MGLHAVRMARWTLAFICLLVAADASAQNRLALFESDTIPTTPSIANRPFARGPQRFALLTPALRETINQPYSQFDLVVNLSPLGVGDIAMTAAVEQIDGETSHRLVARDEVRGTSGLRGILSARGLTAIVETADRIFRIEPLTDSVHLLYEVDPASFAPEAQPLVSPDKSGMIRPDAAPLCDRPLPFPVPPGKGHRIRFLALYTPAAAAQVSDIKSEIQLAFDLTRTAFDTANFIVYAELAAIQAVNLTETDSPTDLRRLTDGTVAGVHTARDNHKADLVVVFTTHKDVCGRAWLNEQPTAADSRHAYGVVNVGCAVSNKTAPHEIGHLIGMQHDRPNATTSTLGYNYGYIIFSERLRSLMAYDDECQKKGYSCKRVGTYSTPNVGFNNEPLGVPINQTGAAHNLEVLCRNPAVISKWR